MDVEYFKIFDEDSKPIGTASRDVVHRIGYWHETFHCWFVLKKRNIYYLYLQLRSAGKQDYPNLLDITAAGHLTADENVEDGVREIKEEIGIDLTFSSLIELGVIKYCVVMDNFIDRELAHTFLYKTEHSLEDFIIDPKEVSGMAIVEFNDFKSLWLDEKEEIRIQGFELGEDNSRYNYSKYVGKESFVPHQFSFYKEVIGKIEKALDESAKF